MATEGAAGTATTAARGAMADMVSAAIVAMEDTGFITIMVWAATTLMGVATTTDLPGPAPIMVPATTPTAPTGVGGRKSGVSP